MQSAFLTGGLERTAAILIGEEASLETVRPFSVRATQSHGVLKRPLGGGGGQQIRAEGLV
jgi:hypothetical protein